MNTRPSKTPATDAVSGMHLFLTEGALEPSAAELVAHLREEGVDSAKAIAGIREAISAAKGRARLSAIRLRINQGGNVGGAIAESMRRGAAEVLADINQVLELIRQRRPEAANVFYRQLESTPEQDLESLLEDLRDLAADDGNETTGPQSTEGSR